MSSAKGALSPSMQRSLDAYGQPEAVIVTPRCAQLQQYLSCRGMEPERVPLIGALCVQANHREIARLSTRHNVGYIEKNRQVRALMDVALGTMGLVPREEGSYGEGVTIAILDTGIEPRKEFEGRIVAFHDVIGGKGEPYDDHGHGTMCAGCAAGGGDRLGQGVAPLANLVVVKAMDHQGGGSILQILRGMQWVSDNRTRYNIRVVSLSLGLEAEEGGDALVRGVTALWRQGVVVVAAAGNSGPGRGSINSPGCAASVLTVGAVDDRKEPARVAPFSSRGPVRGALKPELCAPGVRLLTTRGKGFGLFTGTSAAAPVVAGCAALVLGRHPDWRPGQVKAELLRRARTLTGDIRAEGAGYVYMGEDRH